MHYTDILLRREKIFYFLWYAQSEGKLFFDLLSKLFNRTCDEPLVDIAVSFVLLCCSIDSCKRRTHLPSCQSKPYYRPRLLILEIGGLLTFFFYFTGIFLSIYFKAENGFGLVKVAIT